MALDNLTKSANINATPREIDFVSRFTKNWQALLDIIGITRPIEKTPGTKLTSIVASIDLEDGNVPEGDLIPYSQAHVTEQEYGDVEIEKYRKGVSIEAIKKHGYERAVAKTDEALLVKLQGIVMQNFYNFLATGLTTSLEKNFQMGLAMAKAKVLNVFKSLDLDVTEVVAFVNLIDFYQYLGDAAITVQTAFGLTYIRDFMGYRVIFLCGDSEVPRNYIYATPVENMVNYYVNPANSDFARAGLQYTTIGATPFIGFHTEGNYNTAVSDSYAIMGMYLFAEYLNGIAVINISDLAIDGDADISAETDLLGKTVDDLQEGITIKDNEIFGTLKYVTGYTGFSGEVSEQSGNYLVLHFVGDTGAVIKAQKVGSDRVITLDSDGILITRVTSNDQRIKITSTVNGKTAERIYNLTGLTLETE